MCSQGLFLADHHCRGDASQFEVLKNVPDKDRNNRGYVSFGTREGRENCIEVDSSRAVTLFYRNKICRHGRSEYEEFQTHKPTSWQPRCLIALIEADSRAKLRDELVEAGRVLTDPLCVFHPLNSFCFFTPHISEPVSVCLADSCKSTSRQRFLPTRTWKLPQKTADSATSCAMPTTRILPARKSTISLARPSRIWRKRASSTSSSCASTTASPPTGHQRHRHRHLQARLLPDTRGLPRRHSRRKA